MAKAHDLAANPVADKKVRAAMAQVEAHAEQQQRENPHAKPADLAAFVELPLGDSCLRITAVPGRETRVEPVEGAE